MIKFIESDKIYFSQRKTFSEKYGLREIWDVVDQWPLYCGISNLSRYMAISDLLRSTLQVPGHIAEFGSWRGANILFMAKLLRIFDPHSSKVVHCFESFKGLTEFRHEDIIGKNYLSKMKNRYKGSLEELLDIIALYKMKNEVIIHKGLIEKTLEKFLNQNKALTFSFIYCDTDLYNPTNIILRKIHDRLSKGGLLIMDEWNDEDFPGEGIAVNQFLKKYGEQYKMRHVRYTRKPTLVLEKIKF